MQLTVLVTGGGTATALSVLKALRLDPSLDVRVVLADPSDEIAGRHLADGYVRIPPASDPGFVDALLEAAREVGARVVFPIFEPELPLLAAARPRFERAGILVLVASPEAIAVVRDKAETARFLDRLDLPHPRCFSTDEARALPASAYPLFVKPRDGRGSIDASRVASSAELAATLARVPNPLVQACVEGPDVRELTVDTWSDLDGRFVACSPRVREVIKAGQSYKGVTLRHPALEAACRQICEALALPGPACIQAFDTPEGISIIEINPRVGAASILSFVAGLNGPRWLVKHLRGEALPVLQARPGVRMLRYWQEVFVDAATGARFGEGT